MIESNEMNAAQQTFTAGSADFTLIVLCSFILPISKWRSGSRSGLSDSPPINSEVQVQSELDDTVTVE
jgi:hypothetical protein